MSATLGLAERFPVRLAVGPVLEASAVAALAERVQVAGAEHLGGVSDDEVASLPMALAERFPVRPPVGVVLEESTVVALAGRVQSVVVERVGGVSDDEFPVRLPVGPVFEASAAVLADAVHLAGAEHLAGLSDDEVASLLTGVGER